MSRFLSATILGTAIAVTACTAPEPRDTAAHLPIVASPDEARCNVHGPERTAELLLEDAQKRGRAELVLVREAREAAYLDTSSPKALMANVQVKTPEDDELLALRERVQSLVVDLRPLPANGVAQRRSRLTWAIDAAMVCRGAADYSSCVDEVGRGRRSNAHNSSLPPSWRARLWWELTLEQLAVEAAVPSDPGNAGIVHSSRVVDREALVQALASDSRADARAVADLLRATGGAAVDAHLACLARESPAALLEAAASSPASLPRKPAR